MLPPLYFYRAVTGELALMVGDGWLYSLHMRILLGRMINAGELPLWKPHTFGGMPFLATVQPGVLYPPNWLFAVLAPHVAMNLVVITTYHIALIGTYLYARTLRLSRSAALTAAIIFTFGGFMIGHSEDTNYITAAAWLPWVLLALERLRPSAPMH